MIKIDAKKKKNTKHKTKPKNHPSVSVLNGVAVDCILSCENLFQGFFFLWGSRQKKVTEAITEYEGWGWLWRAAAVIHSNLHSVWWDWRIVGSHRLRTWVISGQSVTSKVISNRLKLSNSQVCFCPAQFYLAINFFFGQKRVECRVKCGTIEVRKREKNRMFLFWLQKCILTHINVSHTKRMFIKTGQSISSPSDESAWGCFQFLQVVLQSLAGPADNSVLLQCVQFWSNCHHSSVHAGVGMATKPPCAFLCPRLNMYSRCFHNAGWRNIQIKASAWLGGEARKQQWEDWCSQPDSVVCEREGCLWPFVSLTTIVQSAGCCGALPQLFLCFIFSYKKCHWLEAKDLSSKFIFLSGVKSIFTLLIVLGSRANQEVLPPARCKAYWVIFKIK